MQSLRVVASADAPEPPYPASTKAAGWRFELDYERIEQSDTWALCPPDQRPWLLMAWMTAWRQVPCGSLPNNDELIAARLGMPVRQFAAHRDILLRGWWLASDGRLYHRVITERVLSLLKARAKEAEWKRNQRQKNQALAADVHPDSTRTPPGVVAPEPEPEPVKVSKTSSSQPPAGAPAGFDEFWAAWPKSERKQDKAKCAAMWKQRQLENVKDLILSDVATKRGTRKWVEGFIEAPLVYLRGSRWNDGVTPDAPRAAQETDHQRAMRERMQQVAPAIAARPPGAPLTANPMDILDGLVRETRAIGR